MVKTITEAHVIAALTDLEYPVSGVNEWRMANEQISLVIYRDANALRDEVKSDREGAKLPLLAHDDSGTIFPLKYLLSYLKTANKLGVSHVQISVKKNSPIVVMANLKVNPNTPDAEGEKDRVLEFVCAPRIDTNKNGEGQKSLVIKTIEATPEAKEEVKVIQPEGEGKEIKYGGMTDA